MACFIVLSIPLVASAESQLSVMPVSSQNEHYYRMTCHSSVTDEKTLSSNHTEWEFLASSDPVKTTEPNP